MKRNMSPYLRSDNSSDESRMRQCENNLTPIDHKKNQNMLFFII
jgi:hypothetical protein